MHRSCAARCVGVVVATVLVVAWPHLDSLSVRLVVASALRLGFVGGLSVALLRRAVVASPV